MSDSINVGVFNVLAAGISASAKSEYSDPDKIYEILKEILNYYYNKTTNFSTHPSFHPSTNPNPTLNPSTDDIIIKGKKLKSNTDFNEGLNFNSIFSLNPILKDWIDENPTGADKIKTIFNQVYNLKTAGKGGVGKALKKVSEQLGISLYGGFRLGHISSLKPEDFAKLIGTEEFQKDFYKKREEFIIDRIISFFKLKSDGGSRGDILICPEFDYFCPTNKEFENKLKIKLNQYGVTYIKVGSYLTDTKSTVFNQTQGNHEVTFNPDSNQFRVIFYTNKFEPPTFETRFDDIEEEAKTYTGTDEENEEKKQTRKKEKTERIDVLKFKDFNLISVHLKSTTAIQSEDLEKKEENLNDIENAINILKTINNNPVIIAGDFNFPIFQKINDKYQTIKGFGNTKYSDDTTDLTLNKDSYTLKMLNRWTDFLMKINVTANSMENFNTTGVCLKERFTETRGNDQVFVGKGDKRAYNTDFIGLYKNDRTEATLSSSKISKIRDISGRPTIEEKSNLLCPYVLFKQRPQLRNLNIAQQLHNLKLAFDIDIDIDDKSLEKKLYIIFEDDYEFFISSIPTETGDPGDMKTEIFDTIGRKKNYKMKTLYNYPLSELKKDIQATDITFIIDVQNSWLSDHSIVMRTINVEEVYEGVGDEPVDPVVLSVGGTPLQGGSRKKRRKKTKKKNSSRKKTKRKRSKRKSSKRSKSKKNKKKTTKK